MKWSLPSESDASAAASQSHHQGGTERGSGGGTCYPDHPPFKEQEALGPWSQKTWI